MALLDPILRRLVRRGRLLVRWPDGRQTSYGNGDGPQAAVGITTWRTARRLAFNPLLAAGECYMDGELTPLAGSVYDLLAVVTFNRSQGGGWHPAMLLQQGLCHAMRRISQFNPAGRARQNAAHHYDLNGRLYSLFLDRDRQYSCAYFPLGDEGLEEAQAAKKRHIAAKLRLDRPGLEVLDIGSGWGGLALSLAREHGAHVTGITLSAEQLAEARARAAAEGLAERVRFELLDYRTMNRRFDRIVSVGMFEHVGVNHYRSFFGVLRRCLAPDGIALLHTIGRSDGPSSTNPWLAKYIFPGGYCPSLSEILPAIERSDLIVTDIEVLRLHYAETLRHWRRRFAANRDTIATLYDERFCRMFEYYLAGAELAFRHEGHVVFQIQLARVQTAVPLTRDYVTDAERGLARAPAEGKAALPN
jgi:cyclopropane-fatty-acyl-phospholipid synthase